MWHANQLPFQIVKLIVRAKQEKPNWGAPKIRERRARLYPDVQMSSTSTVHAVLDHNGLVEHRKRRRNRAQGTPLSQPCRANDLWCADHKGEFMLADKRYCYPLTITDFASRYLLACETLIARGALPVGLELSSGMRATIFVAERFVSRGRTEGGVRCVLMSASR